MTPAEIEANLKHKEHLQNEMRQRDVNDCLKALRREFRTNILEVNGWPYRFKAYMSYAYDAGDWESLTRDNSVLREVADKYQDELRSEGWHEALVTANRLRWYHIWPSIVVDLKPRTK